MANESWIGRVLGGKYTISAELGKGGQGALYIASQKGLDRNVAVKVIRLNLEESEEASARFEREARVIARLNHPNVVQIFDFDRTDDGAFYIVMELVKGESLHRFLNTRNLGWEESAKIVRQIALGLQKVHEAGIVHRDIKPGNIMLTPAEGGAQAKLLDFGIALTTDPGEGAMTQTGIVVGTPGYLAPELTSTGRGDGRADLFSLGVVWFEMLTKVLPVKGDTPMAVVYKTASEDIPPLEILAPELAGHPFEPVLYRMLARDPAQRFGSAKSLVNAIDAVLRGESFPTLSDSVLDDAVETPATTEVPNKGGAQNISALSQGGLNTDNIANDVSLPSNTPVQTVVVRTKGPLGPVGIFFGIALVVALVGIAFMFGRDRSLDGDDDTRALTLTAENTPAQNDKKPESVLADALQLKAEALAEKEQALAEKAAALKKAQNKVAKILPEKSNPKKRRTKTSIERTIKKGESPEDSSADGLDKSAKGPDEKTILTSDDIDKAIAKNFGLSTKCRNTKIRPAASGILIDHCPTYKSVNGPRRVKFKIAPSGEVISVAFNKKVTEPIGDCTLASLKSFRFPSFKSDEAMTMSQSIRFKECTIINGDCVYE